MSCSKKEDIINDPNTGNSMISMKINGELWEGNENFVSGITQGNFTAAVKKTTNGKSESLTMTFLNINQNNDNIINDDSEATILFLSQIDTDKSWGIGNSANNSSGTLKITKTKFANLVTQVSATFSGTTKDGNGNTVVITEGKIINKQAE